MDIIPPARRTILFLLASAALCLTTIGCKCFPPPDQPPPVPTPRPPRPPKPPVPPPTDPSPLSNVRYFHYNRALAPYAEFLSPEGTLSRHGQPPNGTPLTRKQLRRLEDARKGTGNGSDIIFRPKEAFVYFDETGKPYKSIEVCLECLRALRTTVHDGKQVEIYMDMEPVKKLVQELSAQPLPAAAAAHHH